MSKLAIVNNFREEAFELLSEYSPEIVKEGHLCHLKDFLQQDQFKYLFRLSNLPMNPTMLK